MLHNAPRAVNRGQKSEYRMDGRFAGAATANVANNMAGRSVLPAGQPIWAAGAGTAPAAIPAARA